MRTSSVLLAAFVTTSASVSGFSALSSSRSRFLSSHQHGTKRTRSLHSGSALADLSMFLEGLSKVKGGDVGVTASDNIGDTNTIGSLTVPSVGIGTISWSSQSLTTLKNLELQSVVKEAYNSDAALFDTAERYGSHIKTALGLGWGETETLIQKLLKSETNQANNNGSSSRIAPVVATKFTPNPWRQSVESVVEACEQSRQRLGVEQIDLYQLHMPDVVQPLRAFGLGSSKDEIYWEGLAECYKRGIVKNVGVCNYGPTLLMKCQETLAKHGVPLASNQIAYSLIGRHNGSQETVDKCQELGIQVLAYYPFAMGLLTGKYSTESLASINDDILAPSTGISKTALEIRDLKKYASSISPLMQIVQKIANDRGKSIAQVALNYIVCKGAIPIPGARSIAQVKDNIGAMGWRLTEDEIMSMEHEADKLDSGFEGAGFKLTSGKFVGYGVEKWSLN